MAGRYAIDDLLVLRQSPLCVKPPGLPPAEEWMGYVVPQQDRAKCLASHSTCTNILCPDHPQRPSATRPEQPMIDPREATILYPKTGGQSLTGMDHEILLVGFISSGPLQLAQLRRSAFDTDMLFP